MRLHCLPYFLFVACFLFLFTYLFARRTFITDKKLNFFFIGNFEKFIHYNPGVLWQAQALQRKMMEANLGVSYWERKMEQFRLIRADLGIKLI